MESVSFLSLCRVTFLTMFSRLAGKVQKNIMAAYGVKTTQKASLNAARPSEARLFIVDGNAKPDVRKRFKPLVDVAIHLDLDE